MMLDPSRMTRSVAQTDVDLDETAGDVSIIKGEVAAWAGRPALEALKQISQRIKTLSPDDPATYDSPHRGPRNSSDLLEQKARTWGCSAQAQVACHLARASGIPAILVKAVDLHWVNNPTADPRQFTGHVYLEVLIDGSSKFWDPGRNQFFDQSTNPDGRVVYDKGDPNAIVLSHHGTVWEDEAKDLAELIVAGKVGDLIARSEATRAMAASYQKKPFPES